MRRVSILGSLPILLKLSESAVATAIEIITAATAAKGIKPRIDLAKIRIAAINSPVDKVDSRDFAPFFTFMTDSPTSAHPAIPPNNDVMILAMPCPMPSDRLSAVVSVSVSM